MLRERGFTVREYDPLFAPDAAALDARYGFVTCTETAEHFHAPARAFDAIAAALAPGGWLLVMTSLLERDDAFATWWYARDATHVSFYRMETMCWIAARHGWTCRREAPNVVLFHDAGGA